MIRIALDVLGGDAAPDTPIAGARAAAEAWPDEVEILLVGPLDRIVGRLDEPLDSSPFRLLPATDRIESSESPALAVRRKPQSSIVVGLEAVRDGEADAFISAGSTGAVMAASVLKLGVLPGVDRPPVGALVPTAAAPVLVLDVGANLNCRSNHLHQFAHLGTIYIRDLLGIENPRVGLLNVGEEAQKGGDLGLAAHRLLSEDPALRFVGNVEGHQMIEGPCDVLVCDGFVGNVLLKFYESMAGFILGILGETDANRAEIKEVLRFLDYTESGGAPLLGVNGVTILCHGSSPARAIKNAIRTAIDSVRSGMVGDMKRDLERMGGGGGE
jgi:glycerol-3-phosphate acyltransferase PlsX